jgi:hypothetical protein
MPHRYLIFGLTVAALIGLCFGATPSTAQPANVGQWSSPPFLLPYFPVHTHMLPTGKVMIWPGDGGVSGNDPRSWDPASGSVTSLSKPGYDLFCTGHSFLADGKLFVAGGHISNNVGLSRASTYNPFTNTWNTTLPNMNAGRWYPTTTVLANGDVLVVSGDINLTTGVNTLPQVFQVATGTWRNLTSAQLAQDLYPMMLVAPNGRVFNAGPPTTTRYLNTSGTGAWSFVATRVFNGSRDYGSAVMYAPGKVLAMGGGDPPTNTAEVIDLNQPSPTWRAVSSMANSRRQLNALLLPDGKVLVTGGTAASGFNNPSGAVHAAELWDPATENWTTLASNNANIPRIYHSATVLLPDGRVLSTGGNGFPDTEIFSPPYLFKGARPTIMSAPSSVGYAQSFVVKTPDAAISKIRMLRLSSTTHAFNMSQYINELSFSQTAGDLNVTAPPNANVAPPGYYLLFILNGTGVPSVASFVQLTQSVPSPDFSLSATPSTQSVAVGGSTTYTVTVTPSGGFSGTVGFSASGLPTGASASFSPTTVSGSGSTTMTVTTGSSTPVGSSPVTITGTSGSLSRQTGVTLTVTSGGTGGSLSGSLATPSGTQNLTSLGTVDWAHWGLTTAGSFNHKAGVTQQISNFTIVGTGPANRYNNNTFGYSWTNGTPTGSATNSTTGIFILGIGIVVPNFGTPV